MLSMEQTGLIELSNICKKVGKGDYMKKSMQEAFERAMAYAHGYCPKDTGALVESIEGHLTEDGFIITALEKHAVFNEYGSITTPIGEVEHPLPAKKTGVRPFLRPAIYRVRQEMPEIFGKKFQELISHG